MDDAHDAEPEASPSPYVRLPWALVAAGLVGVLVIALGLGLYANRYLRPQVEVAPTPTAPAAAPAPTLTPVPAPTVAPTPTMAPAPTPHPATDVDSNATLVPPTLAATPTSAVAAATTPSPPPTLDAEMVAEVGKAYENYWQV